MASAGLALVNPLLTQRALDVAVPQRDFGMLRTLALIALGALLLEFVLEYVQSLVTTYIGQRVMRDLRLEIFEHLQRLSIPYFDRNPVGRLMTRVTSDVETLNELFSSGVVTVFGDLFTLAAIMVLMLVADWRLALVAFSVIPVRLPAGPGVPAPRARGVPRHPPPPGAAQQLPAGAPLRHARGAALRARAGVGPGVRSASTRSTCRRTSAR